MLHRIFLLSVAVIVSTGCASHISIVRGEMPEQTLSLISDDLVSALSRTSYIESESVFLHESDKDNGLHSAVDQSLRSQGWMVDVGNKSEGLVSSAELKLAYRAETFDSGQFGSYCLLVNDEATTICREWDLVQGVPATLISMTGISFAPIDKKQRINTPKVRVIDQLVVENTQEEFSEPQVSNTVVASAEAEAPSVAEGSATALDEAEATTVADGSASALDEAEQLADDLCDGCFNEPVNTPITDTAEPIEKTENSLVLDDGLTIDATEQTSEPELKESEAEEFNRNPPDEIIHSPNSEVIWEEK